MTTGGGSDQEPVVVWEAANLMEAQVVKGRLESEEIPAFIRGEALGAIYGLTAVGLARADVLVPAPLATKALEIFFPEDRRTKDRRTKVRWPRGRALIVVGVHKRFGRKRVLTGVNLSSTRARSRPCWAPTARASQP